MSVAVLIPFRGGCPHRERALAFVLSQLAPSGYRVVIGRHDDGAWCKALAVDDAFAQADAEVVVVHDADVVTPGLPAAVAAVADGAAWAIPHRGVYRLTESSTQHYMRGVPLGSLPLEERAYLGVEGGGVVVARRDVYEACPLDSRFQGWGGEDESLGFALRALYGPPVRIKSPLVHLWHPPQQRASRSTGSEAGRELRKRYARARNDRDAMSRLIEEGRACLSPHS